jgi:hypothetical protein
MPKIGSNEFINCTVPLVFLNRYLLIEPSGIPLITVILNNKDKPEYEIHKKEPVTNSLTEVTKTNAGIITVADKTGRFIYKIRPASETSIMFGTITQEEVSIRINDKRIVVNGSTFENNTILGFGAGIVVHEDGSIAMGAPIPPFIQAMIG